MTNRQAFTRNYAPYALSSLLTITGTLHFVAPAPFESIVPPVLGDPTPWVYASGVAELACAAVVAMPRTRRLGALATTALLVAVFPANLYMAYDWSDRPWWPDRTIAYARLPLQIPLILWAWSVSRRAGRSG